MDIESLKKTKKRAQDYIVFALDVPTLKDAEPFIPQLCDVVGMFKIGLELFIQAGPRIVEQIKAAGGSRVFLDLKLHDIPATVERAMQRIAALGVDFTTVHCGESPRMLEAAIKGSGGKVGVVGVTVLTSVSGKDIRRAGFEADLAQDVNRLVLKRARMAREAGCRGVVCSGQEVAQIKADFGKDFVTITPGIRPQDDSQSKDDQKRVVTPAEAVRRGADYIVIGRPIRDAKDPRATALKIAEEIKTVI